MYSLKSSPTRTEFNDENRKAFLVERTNALEFVWVFSSKKIFWGLEFESSSRRLFIYFLYILNIFSLDFILYMFSKKYPIKIQTKNNQNIKKKKLKTRLDEDSNSRPQNIFFELNYHTNSCALVRSAKKFRFSSLNSVRVGDDLREFSPIQRSSRKVVFLLDPLYYILSGS